ncbi:MAG: DNA repair protein RecO C-terminal domain-containing protein [Treponema sp.]|jgi:DNA repair protein RecO (recombination protein O)|nr:DNA repair protein RecO C-terminal domain-containing protein [Treponema sp.]
MARNFTYTALVLRVRPSGESNREVTFLTAEEGLIRATVFGGPKSKLRAHAALYHEGMLWVYRNPVKTLMKVTDFDVRAWRPGIRELYERAMAAQAVAETVLAAQGGGGGWEEALALTGSALDALDGADEAACRQVIIRFLWNWAEILGQRPEIDRCAVCGRKAGASQPCACEAHRDGLLWYSLRDGTAVCPSCADLPAGSAGSFRSAETAGYLPVGPGIRQWLTAGWGQPPVQLEQAAVDRTVERDAKALVTAILAGALGKRLSTWDF